MLVGPPPVSAGEQISPLHSSKESERRWATDARVDPEGRPIPIVMVGDGVCFDDADNGSRIAMLSRKEMGGWPDGQPRTVENENASECVRCQTVNHN